MRRHCGGDQACEERYEVTDAHVEEVANAFQGLSDSYDGVVAALRSAQADWDTVSARIARTKEAADGLAE